MFPDPFVAPTEIEPLPFVSPSIKTELVFVRIDNVNVQPFRRADFQVSFLDKLGRQHYQQGVNIEGDEYNAWGDDDTFLIQIAAKKLGFIIK